MVIPCHLTLNSKRFTVDDRGKKKKKKNPMNTFVKKNVFISVLCFFIIGLRAEFHNFCVSVYYKPHWLFFYFILLFFCTGFVWIFIEITVAKCYTIININDLFFYLTSLKKNIMFPLVFTLLQPNVDSVYHKFSSIASRSYFVLQLKIRCNRSRHKSHKSFTLFACLSCFKYIGHFLNRS